MDAETDTPCPKCGHVRQDSDVAPAWQCPACGIAIEKYAEFLNTQVAFKEAFPAAAVHNVVPPLALPNRIASAAPDLVTASLFLWCWVSPLAWRDTLASDLAMVMLMEFFAIHSGMFLTGMATSQSPGFRNRIVPALWLAAFYIPVAGGFAYMQGGWWPALAFCWLLLIRVITMVAGGQAGEFEGKRLRFHYGSGVVNYVFLGAVALLLPMPQLGFEDTRGLYWNPGLNVSPAEVIPWGFLYFGANGLIKLFERPEWIQKQE